MSISRSLSWRSQEIAATDAALAHRSLLLLPEGAPLLEEGSPDIEKLLAKLPGIAPENAEALRKFNDNVLQDKRVLSTILPIRDGVTWINWA